MQNWQPKEHFAGIDSWQLSRRRLTQILGLLLLLLPWGFAQTEVQLEPRVFEIADQLRCPVCTGESVAQSASRISVEMRNIIRDQLIEGKTEEEILAFFQQRYGDWILLNPPRRGFYLFVWVLPIVAASLALITLVVYLRRWTKRSTVPLEADPNYLARVQQSLQSEINQEREAS